MPAPKQCNLRSRVILSAVLTEFHPVVRTVPDKLSMQQVKHATELRESGKAVLDIAAMLNVHPVTVYRALNQAQRRFP